MKRLFWIVILVATIAAADEQKLPQLFSREKETEMALSAAPEHLREGAGVYVLDKNGFVKIRDSKNGFTCIVNRDHPLNLKPTCYDAEGSATILPKVLRIGELMMQGKSMEEISSEIQAGFKSGKFISPRRPGIAYMLSGEIQNYNPATHQICSFPPHVMFYAPNLTNADIGFSAEASATNSRLPFVAYQGPHGFIIMTVSDETPKCKDVRADPPAPPEKGPKAGQKIPAFDAEDQFGRIQNLNALAQKDGLVLLFFRSADW